MDYYIDLQVATLYVLINSDTVKRRVCYILNPIRTLNLPGHVFSGECDSSAGVPEQISCLSTLIQRFIIHMIGYNAFNVRGDICLKIASHAKKISGPPVLAYLQFNRLPRCTMPSLTFITALFVLLIIMSTT